MSDGAPGLAVRAATRLGDVALDVELDVARGRCLALAGPSGAGKSSVLRVVAGLLAPAAGRVVNGADTWLDTSVGVQVAPERRGCGVVFQHYALFGHLRAWQNVAYGLRGPRAARRARAHELLERFGLAARADARPATLSGGERQRVALARALAPRPSVLLLDEPLSALDASTRASATRQLALVLREAGVPALLVTHDFAEAAVLGDEVAVIDRGRIVQRGAPAELAAAPGSAFVADFTGAVVLRGVARRAPGSDAAPTTVVALDGGGEVVSTDRAEGPVAAALYPWEIALQPAGAGTPGSARNRLEAEVLTLTAVGGRVRVGLLAGQPLAAEVTQAAADELALRPGARVTATWKATATRLVGR